MTAAPLTVPCPGDDGAVAARLTAALEAVRLASIETLRWYGDTRLEVTSKADASPVTQADIAAEGILRRELLGAFPDDGFLAEEPVVGRPAERPGRAATSGSSIRSTARNRSSAVSRYGPRSLAAEPRASMALGWWA